MFAQLPRKPVLPQGFENKEFIWEGIPRGNRGVTRCGEEASSGCCAGYQLVTTVGTPGGPAEVTVGQAPSEWLEQNLQTASGVHRCAHLESSGDVGGHRQCLPRDGSPRMEAASERLRRCLSWVLWVDGQPGPYGKGRQTPEAGVRLAWPGRRARE